MTKTIHEEARQVPVVRKADVVVCGGGPAGVAAALAAARAGADTVLIEWHGALGGIWTTGLLSLILDAGNKDGVMREILERLESLGACQRTPRGSVAYDPEKMKLILEQTCAEAGIDIRLHTRVVAAARDENNRLAVAITESKSGRQAFAGKVFIDATGDGDLAAQAGCGFDLGRPADGPGSAGADRTGELQPMSLMCLITGLDRQGARPFYDRTIYTSHQTKDALLAEFQRAGVEPSYGKPTIFDLGRGLYAWMINHEYGVKPMDAQGLTHATLRARAELHQLIDALRKLGDPWSELRIVATAGQIGIREGRRIHGRYVVTANDLQQGRRHDDAVCRATFGMDVHSTNRAVTTGVDHSHQLKSQPYDIPYRALIAADVDGLLLAGRCISGDFLAHSSYRVTGNAVKMGEAAGAAAAVAARTGRAPHELTFSEVMQAIPSAPAAER